ncbi:MAG: Signal peptidase, partial [uncultured Frankineae bacterium]
GGPAARRPGLRPVHAACAAPGGLPAGATRSACAGRGRRGGPLPVPTGPARRQARRAPGRHAVVARGRSPRRRRRQPPVRPGRGARAGGAALLAPAARVGAATQAGV